MGRAEAGGSLRTQQWKRIRIQVLQRDAYECQVTIGCPRPASAVDHIVPRSLGGANTLDNLRASCARCNSKRGNGTRRAPALFRGGPLPLPPQSPFLAQGGVEAPTVHVRHLEVPDAG